MSNVALADAVVGALHASGVREAVVCGGSRNAPLIAALAARSDLRAYNFFEERSAAFFALGRARASGAPVAVITTSGTAAAELLPAAIEAHYSGAPLVLVTADRPARHRGTGAPQAIEQPGLFGPYTEASVDLVPGAPPRFPPWSRRGPIHLNLAFDEPLLDATPAPSSAEPIPPRDPELAKPADASAILRRFAEGAKRPILLLGEIAPPDRAAVRDLALGLGWPVHAEPLSGLREDPRFAPLALQCGDRILAEADLDAVLRLGGVPSLRFWRDLDQTRTGIPVLSAGPLPFSGLPRGAHVRCDLGAALPLVGATARPWPELLERDRALASRIDALLADEARSEPALVRELSARVPEGSLVFLGNSLPIREWDLFADRRRRVEAAGSRGANGIDGQISTFFGLCSAERENWCVVGDLTAMYDLAAPWAVRQIDPECRIRIVVIQNGGGRIFSRVPSLRAVPSGERERLFENPHAISLRGWASMWELPFVEWDEIPNRPRLERLAVVELRPAAAASQRFWDAMDRLAP
ncbi:MAG TPA: 2-succinyl-5-enolpyruvyl-6-hydroxy-3-cyclohexene-1-carboxylic-acid synthase [Thermoanaerobaculia bacterium]|nr:2-succinyl-5-enolpyruvyl-6-hydroxy-3-cyclohexene-1-carboxylic-acid synthase [Thermoanaerobaculia bacterium]